MEFLNSFLEAEVILRDMLIASLQHDDPVPDVYYEWATESERRGREFLARQPTHRLARVPSLSLQATHAAAQPFTWTGTAAWQDAEHLAAAALRKFGFEDARVTNAGADGGIDVRGHNVAAQVKYLNRPVGRPVLQQLVGAADGLLPICFSRSGYSRDAIDYANQRRICLFEVELPSRVTAVNPAARQLLT